MLEPKTVSSDKIIDGAWLFWLMDTKGFPLELACDYLRFRGMGFNVPQFIEAALKSKNYTLQTVTDKLTNVLPEKYRDGFKGELALIYTESKEAK